MRRPAKGASSGKRPSINMGGVASAFGGAGPALTDEASAYMANDAANAQTANVAADMENMQSQPAPAPITQGAPPQTLYKPVGFWRSLFDPQGANMARQGNVAWQQQLASGKFNNQLALQQARDLVPIEVDKTTKIGNAQTAVDVARQQALRKDVIDRIALEGHITPDEAGLLLHNYGEGRYKTEGALGAQSSQHAQDTANNMNDLTLLDRKELSPYEREIKRNIYQQELFNQDDTNALTRQELQNKLSSSRFIGDELPQQHRTKLSQLANDEQQANLEYKYAPELQSARVALTKAGAAYPWGYGSPQSVNNIANPYFSTTASSATDVLTPALSKNPNYSPQLDLKQRLQNIATGSMTGGVGAPPAGMEVDPATGLIRRKVPSTKDLYNAFGE